MRVVVSLMLISCVWGVLTAVVVESPLGDKLGHWREDLSTIFGWSFVISIVLTLCSIILTVWGIL